MRYPLRTLLILLAIGPPALAGMWFMPLLLPLATNCGGNNAARTYLSEYVSLMTLFAFDDANQHFSMNTANTRQLDAIARISTGWGISQKDILISTAAIDLKVPAPRRIIVACDKPFTNVPQYAFRRAAPSHAVAYSDGSIVLLPAHEYSKLDRSAFVRVSDIATAR